MRPVGQMQGGMQQAFGLRQVVDIACRAGAMLRCAVMRQRLVHAAGMRQGGHSAASTPIFAPPVASRQNLRSRFCAASRRYSAEARMSLIGVKSSVSAAMAGAMAEIGRAHV